MGTASLFPVTSRLAETAPWLAPPSHATEPRTDEALSRIPFPCDAPESGDPASVVIGAVAASTLAASLTAGAEATTPQPITAYGFDDGTVHHTVGSAYLTASGTAAVVVTDAERGKVLRVDGTTNGFAAFPQGFFDDAPA